MPGDVGRFGPLTFFRPGRPTVREERFAIVGGLCHEWDGFLTASCP
jgi:hypothetical protein